MTPHSAQLTSLYSAAEVVRHRERALVSRRLHSDVGPTLCAIGLHLGLLKSSLQGSQDALETFSTIESALADTIRAVRGLSYRTDPAIVSRCGLRTALQYLSLDAGMDFDDREPPAGISPEQAEAMYRAASELVLDAVEFAPDFPLSLRLHGNGFGFRCPAGEPHFPSPATADVLRSILQSSFVRMERHRQSGEIIVSAIGPGPSGPDAVPK